jgi:hypothetical protein
MEAQCYYSVTPPSPLSSCTRVLVAAYHHTIRHHDRRFRCVSQPDWDALAVYTRADAFGPTGCIACTAYS